MARLFLTRALLWIQKKSEYWLRFMLKPVVIFISLQIVWLAVLILWVIWFIDQQDYIEKYTQSFDVVGVESSYGLAFLIAGCILLGFILFGTIFLFIFAQKQRSLFTQQQNFVASVTHELRSPLSSLQLGIETLQTRALSGELVQKIYSMIGKDLLRLQKLIDQILISGRLDKGILVFEKSEICNMLSVVHEVRDSLSHLDPLLHERLVIDCEGELKVNINKSVFVLILGNLLENAIKYSPPATSILIRIKAHAACLYLTVMDQGFGLQKREQKKIFKMFHRAESSRKKAIPGTGLGLFIVKNAVRSLGGRVYVESQGPGKGSQFKIELPLIESVN